MIDQDWNQSSDPHLNMIEFSFIAHLRRHDSRRPPPIIIVVVDHRPAYHPVDREERRAAQECSGFSLSIVGKVQTSVDVDV